MGIESPGTLVGCRGSSTTVGISAADIGRGARVCPECGQKVKFGPYNSLKMTAKLRGHKRPAAPAKKPADIRRRRPSALAEAR